MQLALTHYDSGQKAEAVRILRKALQECRPDEADRSRMQAAADQWTEEVAADAIVHLPGQKQASATF